MSPAHPCMSATFTVYTVHFSVRSRPEDRKSVVRQNRFDVRFFVLYGVRPRYGTHEYTLGSHP